MATSVQSLLASFSELSFPVQVIVVALIIFLTVIEIVIHIRKE